MEWTTSRKRQFEKVTISGGVVSPECGIGDDDLSQPATSLGDGKKDYGVPDRAPPHWFLFHVGYIIHWTICQAAGYLCQDFIGKLEERLL